ncbi:nicotinamidase [Geoalkalibacter halelectricus]|uniref:nicotinamidase n=1 Tax=Geoalkalibacter halelectricus TaxID=2847045 RepID=A0ABY5ZGL3_9BACT|nr:nicotinamidase [Geoalkalibacter halelectricus]MDO3380186.1 nicotinamidase [Geoalkalibacter halelectricus]UWZ78241.1 nicotinamidase [Geoalkalibacter halelectricus]
MNEKIPPFKSGDLLLVIDVQKDFCPGGALPIEKGDEVVPVLNAWMRAAREGGIPVYLSRDWHPKNHLSFEPQGGTWPPHCVQDSDGARFHPQLEVPLDAEIVTKGTRFDQDQNSAFDQTGLADWLHKRNIKRIFVGGLAQDVCVLATVLDGCKAGFEMHLIEEATRPVTAEGGKEAVEKMRQAGTMII